MKKIVSLFLCMFLILPFALSCEKAGTGGEKFRIVTTIYPVYDWIRNVTEDVPGVEVTYLLESGVDLHSFQPGAGDIVKISNCDLFVYVGGESDKWVEKALRNLKKGASELVLLDALGDMAKIEENVEGMQESGDGGDDGEEEYDEHVWLSLRNASFLCGKIRDALVSADPDHSDLYRSNAEKYVKELDAIEADYSSAVASAKTKTLLFADRFPFRYLADDYGLEYFAAFSGCSAESEASFETVIFLAGKIDELGLGTVLTIETSDGSIARTVVSNTKTRDQQILTLDSMQSAKDGEDYLGIARKNLEVLKKALQ